ncbi:MAG: CRISPR-associated endonuclease Cas1 [candidate division WOR-3 bacterium]
MAGTLYLVEQGSVLRKEGGRLLVEKESQLLLEVPIANTERVVIEGYVQVSTQALCALLEMGVATVFLGTDGRFKGSLEPLRSVNAPLRLSQYRTHSDSGRSLCLAKEFIRAKLYNQARVIQKALYRRESGFADALEEMRELRSRIPMKTSLNGLMGLEGASTSIYFNAFGSLLLGLNEFRRTRRPPKDPINSMLSYGYAILVSDCTSALAAHGLDPFIGFYHGIKHGRPALALDLMEEFRHPFVDMVVLNLVSRRMVDLQEGFRPTPEGGFLMTPETRKRFLAHYERRALRFRPLIRKQAEKLSRAIRDNADYEPFLLE